MSDDKPIGGMTLRELLKGNSNFRSFTIPASAEVAQHYDICGGSGELPDEDGKTHPCIGCLGCGGPKSEQRVKALDEPDD
jgi:hypothetical protein